MTSDLSTASISGLLPLSRERRTTLLTGRYNILRALAAIALAVSVATAASAEEVSYFDRFELWNDCQPITLYVTPLSQDADDIGLTEGVLETAVRSRLRAARLYDPDSWTPYLLVRVNVVGIAFGLDLAFYKLVNDPISGAAGEAATWTVTWTGTHGSDGDYILSAVSKGMDRFLDEYLRVNTESCQ